MNSEVIPSAPSASSTSISSKDAHPLSLPVYLTSSSSSLKPLRERNRTNLKRRINLSRSQVLSNDFENDNNLSTTATTTIDKTSINTTNSQPSLSSTPSIHTYTELYSKTVSPRTPSPIHTTVTCSQVWDRLASNDEQQNTTSPKSTETLPPSTTVSVLPTHISFSYDPSDDEEGHDLLNDDKNDFQYVPVSSQSKLVQFQFLTFARQQQLDVNSENDDDHGNDNEFDNSDEDDYDGEEDENLYVVHNVEEDKEEEEQQEQENRITKKRKRSVSTTDSLDAFPSTLTETAAAAAGSPSTTTKPPCTKKPKIKDPNANFQRLNMRKKHFSHAKKHQFGKNKRNAFYRRMRHAGGNK